MAFLSVQGLFSIYNGNLIMVGNPYTVSWSLSCILDHNKHIAVLFLQCDLCM